MLGTHEQNFVATIENDARPELDGPLTKGSIHSSRRSSRSCLEKGGVTLYEPIPIGLESCLVRETDRTVVHSLEAVQQHRSVLFVQDRLRTSMV